VALFWVDVTMVGRWRKDILTPVQHDWPSHYT